MDQIFFGKMVFIAGAVFTRKLHEALPFYFIFPQTVYNDMDMDVAAFVMAIRMGTDKRLVSGKIFSCVFKSQLLRLFPGQSVFCHIFGIEADNVMMGFDLVPFLVFLIPSVQFHAPIIKMEGVTVQTVHVIFLTGYHPAVFVQDRRVGVFIMLEYKITLCGSIILILDCNVFQ